jgi:hypothetical protein
MATSKYLYFQPAIGYRRLIHARGGSLKQNTYFKIPAVANIILAKLILNQEMHSAQFVVNLVHYLC